MKYKNYFCDEVIKQIRCGLRAFFRVWLWRFFDFLRTQTYSLLPLAVKYSVSACILLETFFTGHPSWKLQSYDNPVKRNWIWNLPQTCNRNAIIAQQKAQSYFHKTNLEAGEQCTSLSRILYHKGHFAFSFIKKLEGLSF